MANEVAQRIVRIGKRRGATRKEIVSALETGIVESGLRNLRYGDGTSVGWRQETASSYPNVNRKDLKASINRYYNETRAAGRGKGVSAGTLAQSVQRSAYPARYQAHKGQAVNLYRQLAGGAQGGSGGSPGRPTRSVTTATVSPAPIPQSVNTGLADLLASQIQHPAPVQATPPADPAFSARKNLALPAGYVPAPSSGVAMQAKPSLAEQLSAISGQATTDIPKPTVDTKTTVRPGEAGTPASGGGQQTNARHGSPVAHLKSVGPPHPTSGLAGYPARDYFAPAGSAAVAPVSGKVFKLSGSDPRNGPPSGPHGPFGWSVYIRGKNGKRYFLTHMGSRNVKVGERVRQGQKIGTVGDYARWGGANHIHQGVSG